MNEGRERLSLNQNKGPAKPRFFADVRYATSTVPRAGGIASIYRGREIESGKQVAIKLRADAGAELNHRLGACKLIKTCDEAVLQSRRDGNLLAICDDGIRKCLGKKRYAFRTQCDLSAR